MPQAPISFDPQQQSDEQLAGAQVAATNVIREGAGALKRRPGLRAYSGAPNAVVDANGIVAVRGTENGSLYAVGGHPTRKPIYKVTGGGAADVTTATGYKLQGTGRPIIAETEALLVMTAGFEPAKLVLSTDSTSALGGSPPKATHVVANSDRLLLNYASGSRGTIAYSGLALGSSYAGHEDWSGITTGTFQAEARPDPVVALHENTSEVFAFGSTSLQFFAPDPTTAYAPVTTTESGCAAPYSVIKVDQDFAWLDHQRRFVVGDGRQLKVIGNKVYNDILNLDTVSDCYGFRVLTGDCECLVWTFPSAGKTYAYQIGVGWGQWQGFDMATANFKAFTVLSHTLIAGTNANVVGTTDGYVRELRDGEIYDGDEVIVARVRTGFIDRDTPMRKKCNVVKLTLKRGFASGAAPVGFLRWRDDFGAWSDSMPCGFGSDGDSYTVLSWYSLGVYRTRQWEFEFSGAVDFSLVSVTEDYTVLQV